MANSLYSELKDYFDSQKYTDITLKITEAENTTPPVEIKAHRIILAVNSLFFRRLIEEKEVNKERTQELEFKVRSGESLHLKTIVSWFYDKSVIPSLSTPDLISILELSFVYGGVSIVKKIRSVLEKVEPDMALANLVLRGVYLLDRNQNKEETSMVKVKSKFTKFVSEYFSPLEHNIQTHTDFLIWHHGSLCCLLDSDCSFVCSENALLFFVLEWLNHDPLRQTGDNIKELLKKIRVKYLNGVFIHEVITLKNETFNKWNGYHEWICDSLGYLARSDDERKRLKDIDSAFCRNKDLHAWYTGPNQQQKHLCAVRWMVRMTPVEETKRFEPTPHILVHDMMKFSVESTITPTANAESNTYDMTLKIVSSSSMLRLQFVLGIVPADRDYDMSKMFFNSHFARSYLKWTKSSTDDGTSLEFSFWCASEEFITLANQSGLYVCFLPVPDPEYEKFSSLKFLNVHGSYCSQGRGQGGVNDSSAKIKLVPSPDYSL